MISTESTNIHIIRQQYGESILSEARHLEGTGIKYAKYTNHLRYQNNLVPKDLRLKSRIKTSRSTQILERASRQLLQERININHNRRNRLNINIDHQTQDLESTLHNMPNIPTIYDSPQNNLIPKDLRLKSRIKTSRSTQILERASRQLLQERININHNRRNRLNINIDHQTQDLESTLHTQHFEELHNLHNKTYSREMAVTKERHLKKYTTLSTQDQQKQEEPDHK